MNRVVIKPTLAGWREAARQCLEAQLPPASIVWEEAASAQPGLNLFGDQPAAGATSVFRVPAEFITLARNVACHREEGRWDLLYRVLWRLTHGESKLLGNPVDVDVRLLAEMDREIRKELHKMRAFVRFRQVNGGDGPHYVAWYEPRHHILEANAPFFVDRFASMHWSILTPEQCVHWDGHHLSFTEGVAREAAPDEDELEKLWLTYYAHIFNPARVKVRAMEAEMPRRFWKNLPETVLIPGLLKEAPQRAAEMIERSQVDFAASNNYATPVVPDTLDLEALSAAAQTCRACPLWRKATQTVFGAGPSTAALVLLGEQPGDQEDLAGRPFVGPAGLVLDQALLEAGIDRQTVYVTNAVKHFKWEPRGKRRLHQTPSARDVAACRPWMEAELRAIKPEILVCLGATAANAVLGPDIRVLRDRGQFFPSPYGGLVLVTLHPSALLRMPDAEAQKAARQQFVADLRLVAGRIRTARMRGP